MLPAIPSLVGAVTSRPQFKMSHPQSTNHGRLANIINWFSLIFWRTSKKPLPTVALAPGSRRPGFPASPFHKHRFPCLPSFKQGPAFIFFCHRHCFQPLSPSRSFAPSGTVTLLITLPFCLASYARSCWFLFRGDFCPSVFSCRF